jgi:hypothetical protein
MKAGYLSNVIKRPEERLNSVSIPWKFFENKNTDFLALLCF